MAITRTIPEFVVAVAEASSVKANKDKFSDQKLTGLVMRAINAFWRLGNDGGPQGEVGYATATRTLTSGTSTYALSGFTPAVSNLMHLLLVELEADGRKVKLKSYEHDDHPILSDPNIGYSGVPTHFRLVGSSGIDVRPTPRSSYVLTITYVPTLTQNSSTPTSYDTMAGLLDDWVPYYVAREIGFQNQWWDAFRTADGMVTRLEGDVRAEFRKRNRNNPPEMRDDREFDRFGRRVY